MDTEETRAIVSGLDAIAMQYPDLANDVRTLKAQLAQYGRSPDSIALGKVILMSVDRLAAKIAAGGGRQ